MALRNKLLIEAKAQRHKQCSFLWTTVSSCTAEGFCLSHVCFKVPLLLPSKTYVALGAFWIQSLTSGLKGGVDKSAFPYLGKRDHALPSLQLTLGLCFCLSGF